MQYYFAYGSCMDYEGRLMEHGVADKFNKVGVAKLEGYRFRLNKLASDGRSVYANIEPDLNSSVYGILYEIADSIETEYLDVREGFPRHYQKVADNVTVNDLEYSDVLIYIANPDWVCHDLMSITKKYELELKRGGAELPGHYKKEFLKQINRCAGVSPNCPPKSYLNIANKKASPQNLANTGFH